MSTVYVVQMQERRGEPVYDLSEAEQFGKLVYLLPPNAHYAGKWVDRIHQKLQLATADDYLLLIGSPSLIGWAAAIMADYTDGQLNLLVWNRRSQSYEVVKENVYRS